jgi:hypothetical protein
LAGEIDFLESIHELLKSLKIPAQIRLWSAGIDFKVYVKKDFYTGPPGWESISGLLKMFT